MNDIDETTFERFARAFARIERLVPDRPLGPVRPTQARWRASRAFGFAAVAVLAMTVVGLAAIGTNTLPRPTESAAAITVPPDSAGPDVVLDAFLRADVAGDCETSHALKARLLADKNFFDLCGLTDVTAFTVTDGPITMDPDMVRFSGTVTITGIGVNLAAGVYRWTYFVQRQTNGTWRLVDGGYFAPVESAATPGPTRPTPGELQVANPELGGTGWTITQVDDRPPSESTRLSFFGGPTGGPASGQASTECWTISFDYAYDRSGPGIALFPLADGHGSAANGCSPTGLAEYAAVTEALSRVTNWRTSGTDRIELLGALGFPVLTGVPVPPLPVPSADGDCGTAPVDECREALAQAFNFGLFPEPGQTVVGWRIRDAAYSSCATQGVVPKYDVTFELANPAGEWTATVGEAFGKLHACGLY